MACSIKTKTFLNPESHLVVSLGASIGEVGYDIKYASTDYDSSAQMKDSDYSNFMVDGKPLTITPENSPVILTIAGSYLFEPINQNRADLLITPVKGRAPDHKVIS